MAAFGMIVKMNIRDAIEMPGVNGIEPIRAGEMDVKLCMPGEPQRFAKIQMRPAVRGKIDAPDVALPTEVTPPKQ
jgi:hypothetical protein